MAEIEQDPPYEFTAANMLSLVAALKSANALIGAYIQGEALSASGLENYFLEMHQSMGPQNYGLLIDGFLEHLEEQLLPVEDNPGEILKLGTANVKPKSRKRAPEVKK